MRKYSKQREAILSYLKSTKNHPTADMVYSEVRKMYPHISLGTVYRNLNMLAESGTILRLAGDFGSEHYDATIDTHYHFCCRECKQVSDLAVPVVSDWSSLLEYGFHGDVESHTVMFYGLCEQCKNKSKENGGN